MRKKLILGLVVLLVLTAGVGGAYLYLKESTKTVMNTGLSERSKEFLASQKTEQNSSWQTVNLQKKRAGESDFDSQQITVKNCYTITVPFQISDDRQNDPCVYYAILASPRGSLTTSLRTVAFQNVTGAPDVTLRRNKKELYHESAITVHGQSVLVFTDMTGESGRAAFLMIEGKLFTMNLNIAASEDVQMRQVKKILESLTLE